jgi:hypothetical protein
MTDCVYQALKQHLKWLGLPILPKVRCVYNGVRTFTNHQKNENTFAGVVPFIAILICGIYRPVLELELQQNQDFDLVAQANEFEKIVTTNIKQPITSGPGIYCGYFSAHAIFWTHEQMPIGDTWVLSIKFKRLQNG